MCVCMGGGLEVKVSASNVGDSGSIPGSGRSPGEVNGNPLQYSCLENPLDRGAWQATVHGVAKSRTRPSDFTSLHFIHIYAVLSRSVMSNTLKPMDCSPQVSSVHKISQKKNAELSCHALFQGIFLTQGSNQHLLFGR